MTLGIVLSSNDAEIVWNAFRFANHAAKKGDAVKVFLMAKGVEAELVSTEKFNALEQMQDFIKRENAEILACGTCLKVRQQNESEVCPISTMEDLYQLTVWADKVVCF